ncbi:DUF4399 domain-containing protein [Pseudomonas sp. NFX15]|uniref:DUF4399 domain-containing protein n=1 Tax=Pseudomonas sp. NFX15 TaxID=2816958 RepID=UPI003B8DBB98
MKSLMSRAALAGLLMGVSVLASAATPAPKGAEVSIVSPEDGATVPQTFTVKFAVENIALAPAGDVTKNTGHHHLLIDVDKLPAEGEPIPQGNPHIMHFGKAQTQADIKLAPGKHTLQLELGDSGHMPFDPPIVSKKITVNVE